MPRKRKMFTACNRKLTFATAEAIRAAKAARPNATHAQLARQFGCNGNSVRGILAGTLYRHPTRHEQPKAEATPAKHSPNLLCRIERAKRADRLDPIMAEAKREFEAMLAREADVRKGGRPAKSPGAFRLMVGSNRPVRVAVKADPIPDLTTQLEPYYGAPLRSKSA